MLWQHGFRLHRPSLPVPDPRFLRLLSSLRKPKSRTGTSKKFSLAMCFLLCHLFILICTFLRPNLWLTWTEANAWFRAVRCHIHLTLRVHLEICCYFAQVFCGFPLLRRLRKYLHTVLKSTSALSIGTTHIFEVHVRIFCRWEWLLMLNITWRSCQRNSRVASNISFKHGAVHLLPIAMVHLPDFARK